jgi:hypothetical protein
MRSPIRASDAAPPRALTHEGGLQTRLFFPFAFYLSSDRVSSRTVGFSQQIVVF